MEQHKKRFNRVSDVEFVSIFDTKDRSFTTRNYCDDRVEINKEHITGEALKYLKDFIEKCFLEGKIK